MRSLPFYVRILATVFVLITFAETAMPGPEVQIKATLSSPSVHAVGVQFDLNRAFLTDLGPSGDRVYFETRNGGRKWDELRIVNQQRDVDSDSRLYYYNQGTGLIHSEEGFLSAARSNQFLRSFVSSLTLRGSDGLRVDREQSNQPRLLRTDDGGQSWFNFGSGSPPFENVETFDPVSTNLLVASVYSENKSKRPKHQIVMTIDSGKTWKVLCPNPQNTPGIWPTHIFFITEKNGWISSDRDDGLFATADGGTTWRELVIPERVVSGVFFRDLNHGRIIGGVDGAIYETVDAGLTWRKLNSAEINSQEFLDYFAPQPLSRWNEFALLRTIQKRR